ncbi:MAG: PadR family transcriptional regulator [Defluviitaleaceae bacterium]|nr:PadR family transcriptional regulator [Defluviitaleaceae bacterium]
MSLPLGLLGLLRYNTNTGYDLSKLFKESLNSFWHAQHSQIHRELTRMEEKGWVSSQNVIQEGRPNKRVYSITDKGNEVFNEWMNEPADLLCNRHNPLLMSVFFGAASPQETLRRLKIVRDEWTAILEPNTQKHRTLINKYKSSVPNGENESMYWQMVLDYGVADAKMIIKWAQDCIDKLEKELNK